MISFLFVDTERVWRGGQDQLFTLLQGLSQRGHTVHLVCHPRTLLEKRSREIGLDVHPLSIKSELGPIAFFKLLAIVSSIRPDILAYNTPRPILLGTLASRFAPVRARIIFRRVSFPLRRNFVTKLKYNWKIDCIVAISESIRRQLVAGGVKASRIKTIYEGLDLSQYPKEKAFDRHPAGKPIVVGTIAHLSPEKGLTYLIDAASRIPDVHSRLRFVIVGDGECRRELEQQVEDLGLEECFQFAGFQNTVDTHLRSFDIFVLPSLSEGLSSAILAAMATSLPVIATDTGGIPELIRHGENGTLVPPGDPLALAKAIDYLAQNPKECARMGQLGRLRVEEQFTLERKIIETEQLCTDFLKRPASVRRSAHA
jgi:glycosyltransferase involved in cell wall biosynthesis